MSPELTAILAQFGPAGLMGLLWIMERRHAATRERHLSEAHQRLTRQDDSIHALLVVVRDNTRAITALEHTQRHILRMAERMRGQVAVRADAVHAQSRDGFRPERPDAPENDVRESARR